MHALQVALQRLRQVVQLQVLHRRPRQPLVEHLRAGSISVTPSSHRWGIAFRHSRRASVCSQHSHGLPCTAAALQLEGIVHTRAHAQSATGKPQVNPHCTDRGASAFTCPITAATTQQYDGRPDQAVLEPLRVAMTIMERPPHTTTHHDTQL